MIVFAKVEVTLHAAVVCAGIGEGVVGVGFGVGRVGVVGRGVGVGSGSTWDVLLKLLSRLTGTVEATAFGAFLKSEGDIIGDLCDQRVR